MSRKREVLNSHISLYIALVTLVCHSIRLIPTVWEIYQRFTLQAEVRNIFEKYFDILSVCSCQDYSWPVWVEVVTVISHLALTLSASISPYIFPVLYRRNKHRTNQGVRPTATIFSQHLKVFYFEEPNVKSRAKHVRDSAESTNTHIIIESTRL